MLNPHALSGSSHLSITPKVAYLTQLAELFLGVLNLFNETHLMKTI